MVRVQGEAYGRVYDYTCEVLSRTPELVVLVTQTESERCHLIALVPRHVGSSFDEPDTEVGGKPATICGMAFDGEYCALAYFIEDASGDIEVLVHEY